MKPCKNSTNCNELIDMTKHPRREYCGPPCRQQAREYRPSARRINPPVDPDEVDFLNTVLGSSVVDLLRYGHAMRKSEDEGLPVRTQETLVLRDMADQILADAITRDRIAGDPWRVISERLGMRPNTVRKAYENGETKRNKLGYRQDERRRFSPLRRWACARYGAGAEIVAVEFDPALTVRYLISGHGPDPKDRDSSFLESWEGQERVSILGSLFLHTLERALP